MAEILPILFSWYDYFLLVTIMILSVGIGIYFGFYKKKQDTMEEYLLGGKTMSIIPVAISFIASQISGTTLLSVPADVYKFGSNYLWMCVTVAIVCLITNYMFLPIFFNLQFTSIYEYLGSRFDRKTRAFGAFLYILSLFIYNPIALYVPSLAFSQMIGVALEYIVPVLCIICTFYTTIGGLKAVIWTDTLQFGGILIATIAVLIAGIVSAGGLGTVWEKVSVNQHMDLFNFSFDPTMRDSFWILIIGGTFHMMTLITINQSSLQKFLAVPTLQDARKTVLILCIGLVLIIMLCVFIGNVMYAKYSVCDPLSTNQVERIDQLLPYFIMSISKSVPGLPGIFIAGVFCATLSSLSVCLNTLAGTVYEELVAPCIPSDISEKTKTNILKFLVITLGVMCLSFVTLVDNVGGVFPFATSVQGITCGPLLGLFILGIMFPIANSTGALFGGTISIFFVTFLACGQYWYKSKGFIKDFSKGLSTDGCNFAVNLTLSAVTKEPPVLYQVSFWYNTFIGTCVVLVVGLFISLVTREKDHEVSNNLITPVLHFMYPEKAIPEKNSCKYNCLSKDEFKFVSEKGEH